MIRFTFCGLILAVAACLAGISWAGVLDNPGPMERQPFFVSLAGPGTVMLNAWSRYTVTVTNWTHHQLNGVKVVLYRQPYVDSYADVVGVFDQPAPKLTVDGDGDHVWRVNLAPGQHKSLTFKVQLPAGGRDSKYFVYNVEARFANDYYSSAVGAFVRSQVLHP